VDFIIEIAEDQSKEMEHHPSQVVVRPAKFTEPWEAAILHQPPSFEAD
jgi:hypothetical protein